MAYPKNMEKHEKMKLLVPVLASIQPGGIVTYETISATIHQPYGSQFTRDVLNLARAHLARESVFFNTVRGEGLRRLTGTEFEKSAARLVQKAHNSTKRGYQIVSGIPQDEFNLLSNANQLRHALRAGQLEHLERVSGRTNFEKVVKRNNNVHPDDISADSVAAAFGSLHLRQPRWKS